MALRPADGSIPLRGLDEVRSRKHRSLAGKDAVEDEIMYETSIQLSCFEDSLGRVDRHSSWTTPKLVSRP